MYIITYVGAICERSFRFSARTGLRGRHGSSGEQNASARKSRFLYVHQVRFQSKNLTLSLLVSKISVFTVMICIAPERARARNSAAWRETSRDRDRARARRGPDLLHTPFRRCYNKLLASRSLSQKFFSDHCCHHQSLTSVNYNVYI